MRVTLAVHTIMVAFNGSPVGNLLRSNIGGHVWMWRIFDTLSNAYTLSDQVVKTKGGKNFTSIIFPLVEWGKITKK